MSNLVQVKHHVKYSLHQLADENGHHKFEHICRELVRRRICSNIIPSTGPVSAGGDQGVDFESFRTHIKNEFGNSTFLGLKKDGFLVFACTIQKSKLDKKIKEDVSKICKQNDKPSEIHYFLNQSLATAKRHELKKWAAEDGIHLAIYDIEALSELLADYELFYISEQYLDIPPEIFPKLEDKKYDDYYSKKDFFTKLENPTFNYSEFIELKLATRRSTFVEKLRSDLPFWITKLDLYISDCTIPELKERATYEKIVCSLRGLNTLIGQEEIIKEYLSGIENSTSTAHIERLQIILSYVTGAIAQGVCSIPAETLPKWRTILEQFIESEIRGDCTKAKRLTLLRLRGAIAILEGATADETINNILYWWEQIPPELENVPYFPLESFSDHITEIIELLGGTPQLNELADKVETALSKRVGSFIAAEKARDRALAHYRNGQVVPAISLLHSAAINWHHKETLKGSLLSLIFLSKWYAELKLAYAAKYFSMAAFLMAFHDEDKELGHFLPKIAQQLSSSEYLAGNWLSFLETSRLFLMAYRAFDKAPQDNFMLDDVSKGVAAHVSILGGLTELVDPTMAKDVVAKISELENNDVFEETIKVVKEEWAKFTKDQLTYNASRDLADVPFADTGEARTIQWKQYGIHFKVTFKNDKDTAVAAESFVAALQILFVDLAEEYDLQLLPGESNIDFKLEESDTNVHLEPIPSNETYKWELFWPRE